MLGYIFGVILYLLVGYVLSLVIGLNLKFGDGLPIFICMTMWPIVLLLMAMWTIEDVLMYLYKKKR